MYRRSLRFRLLAIILIGLSTLTVANVLINQWALARVRDRAIDDSSQALQQLAIGSFQRQIQERASTTGQTLSALMLVASTTSHVLSEELIGEQVDTTLSLPTTPDGWRYQQGVTTVLIPPGNQEQALIDIAASQQLDVLFPGLVRLFPETSRISFLSSSGMFRTFPQINLTRLPEGWMPNENAAYQANLPENNPSRGVVWLPPHEALETSERVISAVAPVYLYEKFAGIIVVDINLELLTRYLKNLGGEQDGFGFVIDHDGNLITAPPEGQQLLLGRAMTPAEHGSLLLEATVPSFKPVVAHMRSGSTNIARVTLQDQPYFVTHAHIPEIEWSAGIAVPIDKITESTASTAKGITSLASNAQMLALLISVVVVVALCVVITFMLRRQFTRPLAELLSATKAIAAGERRHLNTASGDELGQLARSFNSMTDALYKSRAEIIATNQRLEQTVQERTADLQHAVIQLEEANRLKTQFLSNMSHELRTPLNSIINFARLQSWEEFGSLSQDQDEFRQRILDNGEHLLGLINDILDLSKIEAGRMDLNFEELDLVPVLKGLMSTAIGLTKDKGLGLELEVDDDLAHVWADRMRVRQVLLNALSNAAKFTREGKIAVHASETSDGFVCVSVQDTGIGIPEDKQHLVFEEFRQIDGELSREHQGTGLGMPISQRLIEAHGGQMWFESEEGVGSTFFFTLPLFRPGKQAEGDGVEQAGAASGAHKDSAPLIVTVDDDPDSQGILRHYLEGRGYRIHPVLDSRQALATIEQLQPQLIILDVRMPHLDGWQILVRLREQASTSTIPVLMCTIVDEQRLGLSLGARGYLVKPIDGEILHNMVSMLAAPASQVLVIDDDPEAREVMRLNLNRAKYQVIEASNGDEGLEKLRNNQVKLIILDLMMPGMDGFDVLRQLRYEQQWMHIPVVIVTAKDLSTKELQWLSERSHTCIQKSQLSMDEFLEYIGHLVP